MLCLFIATSHVHLTVILQCSLYVLHFLYLLTSCSLCSPREPKIFAWFFQTCAPVMWKCRLYSSRGGNEYSYIYDEKARGTYGIGLTFHFLLLNWWFYRKEALFLTVAQGIAIIIARSTASRQVKPNLKTQPINAETLFHKWQNWDLFSVPQRTKWPFRMWLQ